MPTQISSVGVFVPQAGDSNQTRSVELSALAIEQALDRADITPNELGFLVSNAIYKENNIAEPALAALIQKRVGANPEGSEQSSTFSFDVIDGGGGAITSMELIAGFIDTEEIRHGIVVTSDVNPDEEDTVGFKYQPAASAVLLSSVDHGSGFQCFKQYDFPQHREELKSTRAYRKHPGIESPVRGNILIIEESAAFEGAACDCAASALTGFLNELKLSVGDIDLIIPSQYPPKLPLSIKETCGLQPEKIVDVTSQQSRYYTAGIGIALHSVFKSEVWHKAKTVVFLAVSPGMKVTMALYTNG